MNAIVADVDHRLPRLAWLVDLAASRPRILCGADVELFADGLFEGCWDGAFESGGFDRPHQLFGSGFRIHADEILFLTPSHTLDALFVLERGGTFVVANSLPFLVQYAGLELPFDLAIGFRFASVKKGVAAYERLLFTGAGWRLHRITFENFVIGREGLRAVAKPAEPDFTDYAGYRSFLHGVLGRVATNAASPARRARYGLMTTCSSGYDSTACAALAASLGGHRALSLRTAKGGDIDSGRPIAQALGLELTELERPSRAVGGGAPEAEFLATGMGGEDYVFVGFGGLCSGSLLLTGFHGDIVWDRHAEPTPDIVRKDISGSTMGELRLREGFVHVPVPFLAARRLEQLVRVANSGEMVPYQVGGRYDRPIPRRIVEESGVARGSFAQVKRAGSIAFNYMGMLWSSDSLAELRAFERRTLQDQGFSPTLYRASWGGRTGTLVGFYAAQKVARRIGLEHVPERVWNSFLPDFRVFTYNHARYGGMATLWAIDRIRSRYPTKAQVDVAAGSVPDGPRLVSARTAAEIRPPATAAGANPTAA